MGSNLDNGNTTVRIDDETHQRLKAEKEKSGISIGRLVKNAVNAKYPEIDVKED